MTDERKQAIESGVANAVDTVIVDKAMSRDQALSSLSDFVSDGLSCYGQDDQLSSEDLAFAKSIFPL